MEVAELTGRQFDAAVAERVMGLVPCTAWKHENLGSAGGSVMVLGGFKRGTQVQLEQCIRTGKTLDEVIGPPCPHGLHGCYPHDDGTVMSGPCRYSTDIAAAWAVVEKLHVLGFHTNIGWFGESLNDPPECRIWKPGEWCHNKHWYISALTVPEAICRAALKAVES